VWIIALIGSLVVLAAFILWVPLDIIFDIDVNGKPRFTVRYSWLFGLIKLGPRPRAEVKPRPAKPARQQRRRRHPDIGLAYRMLRVRGLLKNFARLIKGILASFRLTGLAADFRLGLGDPADTGMLFAVLGPAAAFLGPAVFERVNLLPAFDDDPSIEGNSHGTARLRPIRLLPHLLRFTFSPPTARALWTLLKARLKRK
jgi:hypothetical protein